MFSLLRYLRKKDYCFLAIMFAFVVFNVWLELKIPEYMYNITQIIGNNYLTAEMVELKSFESVLLKLFSHSTLQFNLKLIWVYGIIMVICAIGSLIGAIIVHYMTSRIFAEFGRKLRKTVFEKVTNFSPAEIKHYSTASLITRTTNDITQVQNILARGIRILFRAPVMSFLAIYKIIKSNVSNFMWTLAIIVSISLIVVVVLLIIFIAIPKFKEIQYLTDGLNRVTREELTGTRVVRAFNAESYQEEKFDKVNTRITNNHLFVSRVMSLLDPIMTLIMSGIPVAIYIIGAFLIHDAMDFKTKGEVLGCMMTFSTYAIQVVMSFVILISVFIMFPRAQVSANRINEVLKTKNSIDDGSGEAAPIKTGEVQFVNVGFKYPDAEEYVLHDINLVAKKGEMVAFIGSTGSGKSTLINLVPRLYDATEGQVIVDGVNVKDYKISDLNNKIGYISQKAVLFLGTVKSNLELGEVNGEKPTEESLKKAIDISQSNFVYDLSGGLDAEIDQGGKNVSGGQKQRLSIARALARNPEILIFDDSFSALDYKTDKALRAALKEKSKDTTCLIVAQRIGTIIDADKIYVLNEGTIVGEGTHKQLMESCEVYREIALSQLSKEELDNA